MIDYLNIGSAPADESCAQVGNPEYPEKSRRECQAFLHQLKRQLGDPPTGVRFTIKTFPHDFGEYREVCVTFDDNIEEAVEYAFKAEREMPEKWDEKSRKELI